MRMRKKKHGAERILACSEYFVPEGTVITESPIELEIGCGKGSFVSGLAKRYPEKSFIAMERVSDVILLAAERIKNEELGNVRFIIGDARNLKEHFPLHSVSRLYLNFSDPWPKKGYAKRRLTHRGFLELYKEILVPNGEIVFKTDNIGLFEFSLEEFAAAGFKLRELSYDLHNSEYEKDNLHTEYEDNFSAKGFAINRVEAYKC